MCLNVRDQRETDNIFFIYVCRKQRKYGRQVNMFIFFPSSFGLHDIRTYYIVLNKYIIIRMNTVMYYYLLVYYYLLLL